MLNVKAVLFDLGGVLVSLGTPGEKFDRLVRAAGGSPGEGMGIFPFLPEVRKHMTGEIDSPEFYRLAAERFNLDYSFEDFAEAWCDMFQPMPGMEDLFKQVASRHAVSLVSDTDPLHWAALCRVMPYLATVDKPTLSFNVGYLKPHPTMYTIAAESMGGKLNQCLFIDDKKENVDGARYFGMPALQFTGIDKLRKDLIGLEIL